MGREALYGKIWKYISPCVKTQLYDEYRDVNEMTCCNNWPVVHVTCRTIICKGMDNLGVSDPHDFDKAVCWAVVKNEWDMLTKWRCICAFFLAAAMELVIVKREEERKFKKAGSSDDEEDPPSTVPAEHGWSILDLFRRINDLHAKTADLHEKHDKLHEIMKGGVSNVKTTHTVHVNVSHAAAPGQATPVGLESLESLDDLTKRILEIMRVQGGR